MLIIAHHNVSKPEEFWGTAKEITKNLPGTLKLHGVYPSTDTRSGTCLWEANSVHEVQQFLDKKTGQLAKNFCYEVNVKESMGLPTVKLANALAN
jgi:hypothetical protein